MPELTRGCCPAWHSEMLLPAALGMHLLLKRWHRMSQVIPVHNWIVFQKGNLGCRDVSLLMSGNMPTFGPEERHYL